MSEPVNESQAGGDTEQQAQTATPAVTDGSSAGGEGRTQENSHAELSRKYKKLSGQINELAESMKLLVERSQQVAPQQARFDGGFAPSQTAPQVASPYGAPRLLVKFTDEQLNESLRGGGLSPVQQEQVRTELSLRDRERWFDHQFATRERQQRVSDLKKKSDKAADDAYPALREPESDFSRRVEAELQEQRRLVGEQPTERLDAANRVALQMGVRSTRVYAPGYVAPADGGDRPTEQRKQKTEPLLTDGKISELERKFASTMPYDVDPKTGMPVRRKFNTKRIRESSQQYAEAADIMRGPGVRRSGNE